MRLRGKGDSALLESTDNNASVDKITQFSLRPPELLKLLDMVGNYFCWFQISKSKTNADALEIMITEIA